MAKWLERVQAMARGELPNAPITRFLGMSLQAVGDGQATYALTARTEHENPMGTLHGGVLCDLADAAMGTALATVLADDEAFTTLELKTTFLKPIRAGTEVRAVGKVVKRGRTVAFLECEVLDPSGALVARVSSTCLVMTGKAA